MNYPIRLALFLVSALLAGALLVSAFARLPAFGRYGGPYGDLIMHSVVDLRRTPQGVAAVTFDFRGFDTLGEEFILFAAVAGTLLLMRSQQEEREQTPKDGKKNHSDRPPADTVHLAGLLMFPVTLLLGISMVVHGHLTPGGGFQGGVILATAFYFLYLSGEYEDFALFTPDHQLDYIEAAGVAAFSILALLPLLLDEPFMKNIWPFGTAGKLFSAGSIPLDNLAVGAAVGGAFVLLVSSFLRQVLSIRKKD